jgi:iron(III)-enterobactin esterase
MTPEEHTITSQCGTYTRKAWLLRGPTDQPHPLYLFLDGEVYLHEIGALPILSELMASKVIPAASCLFLSYGSPAARLPDYTCNAAYARFLAGDVVKWARENNEAIQPDRHLIAGLSMSALAGAYATFQHPEVFSFALCQSGSFWWLKDRSISWPATSARFWLSVGDEETATHVSHPGVFQELSQIEGVARAASHFTSLGGTTEYRRFPGGHTAAAWKETLAPGFQWLLQTS